MKTKILIVGRHPARMTKALEALSHRHDWQIEGALTDADAEAKFEHHSFDVVVVGGGVEPESYHRLKSNFERIKPTVHVFQHFGQPFEIMIQKIEALLSESTIQQ